MAAPIAGCVPINILGPAGSITGDQQAYVAFTGIRDGFSDQKTALAQIEGRLLSLPDHGDVSIALGGDFRREAGGATPDPLTVLGDTLTNAVAPTHGSFDVIEGFGELSVVPITGKPLVDWLEFSLAARAFRYSTSGSGVTWKAGALIRTINGISLRGTYSTAFRAPTINEMFFGQSTLFAPGNDPCDTRPRGTPIMLASDVVAECTRQGVPATAAFGSLQQRVQVAGNPDLDPEKAKILTTGVVLQPPQLPGLALTADYWRADVDQTINRLTLAQVFANCFSRHNMPSCEQIHRNATLHTIDFVDLKVDNVGDESTSGLDLVVSYDHDFGGLGRFREQIESEYLFKYTLDNSLEVLHLAGNYDSGARPRIRGNLTSLWIHPTGVNAGVNGRLIGSYNECEGNDCNGGAIRREVPAWYKLDAFVGFALKTKAGTTSLTVGVNNFLDRAPPTVYGGTQSDSDAPTYDYMGRFYYARMSQQF
jgi:outer membrane receptor protein involved in Fe transport